MTSSEIFTERYMKLLEEEALRFEKEVKDKMMEAAAVLLALYLTAPKSSGYNFRLTKGSDSVFLGLKASIYESFTKFTDNGIRLSQLKNEAILNKIIETPILNGWLTRTVNEMTLKGRISKYVQMFKMEMEGLIAKSITDGANVKSVLLNLSKNIYDPYKLLQVGVKSDYLANRLSKNYLPKTGKFRSSFANFKRLLRSEIIEAYRRADNDIWKHQKNVSGVLVYLSPAHPKYDMCDELIGLYPKNYIFTGFHPSCICLARPIIGGNKISGVPSKAKEYMNQEKPRKWWGKLPFITENLKYWE